MNQSINQSIDQSNKIMAILVVGLIEHENFSDPSNNPFELLH